MEVIQNQKTMAWGSLQQILGYHRFGEWISHHRADTYMYKKENYQQPVMGHIVWKKWIQFALNCFNNHTGSTCSQIFTHPYQSTCKMQKQSHKELNPGYENIFISHFCRVSYNVLCQIQGYIFFVRNGPQCKNYMGGGVAWGKFNDQTEPIVLFQVSSNPYQGTYQMQKQSVLFQFQSKI